MEKFRKEINKIDEQILQLICKRLKCSAKIGEIKKKEGLPILNRKRESEIYQKLEKMSVQKKIDPKYIKKIWGNIIKMSREHQK